MKKNVYLKVYYSEKFPKSVAYAEGIKTALDDRHDFSNEVAICEIEENIEEWDSLGIMSAPAIVFYIGSNPISNIISYSNVDLIIERLNSVQPQSIRKDSKFWSSEYDLIPYDVIGTSGCHRYARWHDDKLSNNGRENGWCAPSRKEADEYIILQLKHRAFVRSLTLIGRMRLDGTDSKLSLPKEIEIFRSEDLKDWFELPISEFCEDNLVDRHLELQSNDAAKWIKIIVKEKNEIDGKFFPALAGLKVFGRRLDDSKLDCTYKPGDFRMKFSDEIFIKHGLFSKSNTQVEQYNLTCEQKLPTSVTDQSRSFILIQGEVTISLAEETQLLKKLDVLNVNPNVPISVTSNAENTILFTVYTDLNQRVLWEAR